MEATANRFYADVDQFVLLTIDAVKVPSKIIWEPPTPGSDELFPHIYGPLPIGAVVAATFWLRTIDESGAGWSLDRSNVVEHRTDRRSPRASTHQNMVPASALVRARHVVRDPPAVEAAVVRVDAFVVDPALVERLRVERPVIADRLECGRRLRVGPARLGRDERNRRPRRRSSPHPSTRTRTVAPPGAGDRTIDELGCHVVGRRLAGLQDADHVRGVDDGLTADGRRAHASRPARPTVAAGSPRPTRPVCRSARSLLATSRRCQFLVALALFPCRISLSSRRTRRLRGVACPSSGDRRPSRVPSAPSPTPLPRRSARRAR